MIRLLESTLSIHTCYSLFTMSTCRGNNSRKRPQKHQNKTAFKNDLHDSSRKTKILNSLEVSGVCKRCKDIIEWKIKYKKYKPLTSPAKCVGCNEKAVKHAYHVLCENCAAARKVCAKCAKQAEQDQEIQTSTVSNLNTELQAMLKSISERKRRTVLRYMQKHEEAQGEITPEDVKTHIKELLIGMKDFKLDDHDDDDECDFSSDDLSNNGNEEK